MQSFALLLKKSKRKRSAKHHHVSDGGGGKYHGKGSFDLFSNHKSVLHKSLRLDLASPWRYPPYNSTPFHMALVHAVQRKRDNPVCVRFVRWPFRDGIADRVTLTP